MCAQLHPLVLIVRHSSRRYKRPEMSSNETTKTYGAVIISKEQRHVSSRIDRRWIRSTRTLTRRGSGPWANSAMAQESGLRGGRRRIGCFESKPCETNWRRSRDQISGAVADGDKPSETSPGGKHSVEVNARVVVMRRLKRNREAGVGIEQLRAIGLVIQIRGEEKQRRN